MITLSLWTIIGAAVANIIIGFIWYHPRVFGTAWMRMANVSPETAERGKKRMPVSVIISLLAGMLVAYVLANFGAAWGVYDYIGAIELGFWVWIGFVAPAMLGMVLWEGKPVKLYVINVGYWLVALVVMSVILLF